VRKGQIVRCGEKACGGLVKPDIVFFGEGLPDRFFEKMGVSSCSSRASRERDVC
jgi:NAD-dependent histone deacetylase SIR2/NAD-dependent deacetylase sirtuin 2